MNHITSNELRDFRLGCIFHMEFTYVSARLFNIYISYFWICYRTVNDVHDSRAKEFSDDGMVGINFTEPCHQIVRFVDRAGLIEPVELQVVVIIVRDALEASYRRFDMLQYDNLASVPTRFGVDTKNVLCEACSSWYYKLRFSLSAVGAIIWSFIALLSSRTHTPQDILHNI